MEAPVFKTPAGENVKKALAFCAEGAAGVEAYTFLRLNEKALPPGRFFCAENAAGEVFSAVFYNGDMPVKKEAGVPPYGDLCVMEYRAAPPPETAALPLTLADTLAAYAALGGGFLTPENELRYVYRARALREGLACGFGIKENGALAAFAYITAQNVTCAMLGDVYTLPAFRGRGYAHKTAAACVRAALAAGKRPVLVCAPEMRGFYKKMGFEVMKDQKNEG